MKKNLFLLLIACQLFATTYLKAQTVENINGTDVIVKPADSIGVKRAYALHLNELRMDRNGVNALRSRIANAKVSAHADSISKNTSKLRYDKTAGKKLQTGLSIAQSQLASDQADSATWVQEIKTFKKK